MMKSMLQVASMFVVFATAAAGAAFAQGPLDPAKRNVSYPGPGGVTLQGYLALPSGSGQAPGVVMVHEWWGLNRDITLLADALAKEGFVVLAADAFRGRVAQTPDDAMKLVNTTPGKQIAADLDAALAFLRSQDRVDSDRVASLGFCFGGTQTMFMGTRDPELAAVVIFYGPGPIADAGQLGSMRQAGPVLGIYGEQDPNIPVAQVRSFQSALNAAGVAHTVTVYPGVGHAFVKSSTYRDGGAAEKAWEQMVAFLKQTLKD
jgi:carboxymethylenebutenolidase